MIRQYGLDQIERDDRSVLTVGTFDGVHQGHRPIIGYLVERARAQDGCSVVVTFDPHPREVVTGEPVSLLTTLEERADLLEQRGLDRLVVLPFTRDLSMLTGEEYVRQILIGAVGLREIVIGYDHAFGHRRSGNRQTLEALAGDLGFSVDVIPEQEIGGRGVSSTRVRTALREEGDVEGAAVMLGRNYRLAGTVVRGDRRGTTIGYPTANLRPANARKLVPKPGVYAVRASNGGEHDGMMNIGRRPTFLEDADVSLEVHLFDFDGDLYGDALEVEFVARLRDEQRFSGLDEIRRQLAEDERHARSLL
jgi:riboflavin kinase / FMN adenylyltransferase